MSMSSPKGVKKSQTDEAMCLRYYGAALRLEAFDKLNYDEDNAEYAEQFLETIRITGYPVGSVECRVKSPDEYAKSVRRTVVSPSEYLNYLGEFGFDVEQMKSEAQIHEMRSATIDELRGSRKKAEAFFDLFLQEWTVDQTEIEKYLDGYSIYHFIELVVANAASAKARLNALKKHAVTNSAKVFVRAEWVKLHDDYDGNKSAFARDYSARLSHEFKDSKGAPLKVTEKQIREVWLSDTPPASKQAG